MRDEVRGACEILGIDPLYVVCEGPLVAVVDDAAAEIALQAMRSYPLGESAAVIGTIKNDPPGLVLLKTQFGAPGLLTCWSVILCRESVEPAGSMRQTSSARYRHGGRLLRSNRITSSVLNRTTEQDTPRVARAVRVSPSYRYSYVWRTLSERTSKHLYESRISCLET